MRLLIINGLILRCDGMFSQGHIGVEDGKIAALWHGDNPPEWEDAEVIDADGRIVSPGLVDTHIHGGCGFDFTYDKPGWEKLEKRLAAAGVTSILATISSRLPEETLACIDRVRALAERNKPGLVDIAGIHLEGPYLNKKKNGIHVAEYIRPADKTEIRAILDRAGGMVKVWTTAPDIPENMAAIPDMAAAGVSASIAHTEADYQTALAAFSAGANRVTHTFNTMPPISHRYEGIITAAWQYGAFTELIADGRHVSPTIAKMFIAASDPGKVVLVSDNNEFSGLPEGRYIQDGRAVIINGGRMTTEDNVLAGSLVTLNQCVLNLTRWGFPAGAALKMASENPARSAGLFNRKGSIAEGKDADIVIMDGRFEPVVTIKGGNIVFRREQSEAAKPG